MGGDWNQKKVSQLEDRETTEPDLLEKIAQALKVPVDAIKNFDEDVAVTIISSTLHNMSGIVNYNPTFTFNPLDKWIEAVDKNEKLYERLLQAEKEKLEMLERLLQDKK